MLLFILPFSMIVIILTIVLGFVKVNLSTLGGGRMLLVLPFGSSFSFILVR